MNLRPYQLEAEAAIAAQLAQVRSTLVEQATGTGKTVLFGHVAKRWVDQGKRVLIIAHREELIWQAASAIRAICHIEPAIEMAEHRSKHKSNLFVPQVVIATIQTMRRRLKFFGKREFDLIVFDECHHAVAGTYRKIESHFDAAKVLGVTATADRADKLALGQVFETVAFQYGLADAIRDGWLTPIRQRSVRVTGLDFSSVRTSMGDLHVADLSNLMEYERNLHEICDPAYSYTGNRKALVFAVTVRHADRLAEILNRHEPGCAEFVCGETPKPKRAEIVERFRRKDFRFLVNVGVFTEGFDDPGVDVIIVARPTKSRALYCQMIGRGTRPLPGLVDGVDDAGTRRNVIAGSDKPFVEVIDFEGNAGRHKLINTLDILGGRSEQVVERAKKAASDSEDAVDSMAVLETIEEEEAEAERRRLEQRASRLGLVAKAKYNSKFVDPFDLLDIVPPQRHNWRDRECATSAQVRYMQSVGIDEPESYTKQEAMRILDEVARRREAGLCTIKQAKVLTKFGADANNITFERAGQLITWLKSDKKRFWREIAMHKKKEAVA